MSNVYLFAHGGSGNHGCEALVRSTVRILGRDNITLISSRPDEDIKYELDKLCTIIKETNDNFSKKSMGFIKAYLALKLKKDYIPMEKLRYKEAFDRIQRGDIALSIGGDNYCYSDAEKYVMMHDMLKERGAKTVLWGCSIEPEIAVRKEIAKDLARYDMITARETITYETVKKINSNTVLVSDPAFQLDVQEIEAPGNFIAGNTVGINLSPMAIEKETVPGITWKNYSALIDYILKETDMNIALVPHVVWEESDDRVPLAKLFEMYKSTDRVCLIEDDNCMKLKYLISNCRFFVGARTHSTIAAYSTGVPTLVLGYSVKSRGIARNLFGTEDGYVVPVQQLKNGVEIRDQFIKILKHETEIRKKLSEEIPGMKDRSFAKRCLVNL